MPKSRARTGKFVLRDKASRYGTFVNGEPASECELRPGDRIRLGRGGGADLLFISGEDERLAERNRRRARATICGRSPVLLEGFRALGSGRVLQEVLELVLDAAVEISGAERAFIMLADADGQLEFKLARGKNKQTLTDSTFQVSQKIPEEVFRLGRTQGAGRPVGRRPGERPHGDRRARDPQRRVRAVELRPLCGGGRGARRGPADRRAVSGQPREGQTAVGHHAGALETLAAEASVAIENARLYRDKLEKSKMEQEMRIAAEIQQALLPQPRVSLGFVEAAAASIPCRSIGGDFFDYIDDPPAAIRLHPGRRRRKRAARGADERADAGHVRGAGAIRRRPGVGRDAHEQGAVPARPGVAFRHPDVRDHAA